jgi:hypothetical protein
MLEVIPADELALDGKALAVRYKEEPDGALLVWITAHDTDDGPEDIRRSEMRILAVMERMSREALRARVEAEAASRKIERVAWISES